MAINGADRTYSGVAVTAANCAGLQPPRSAHVLAGGALQSSAPVAAASACRPPPLFGSRIIGLRHGRVVTASTCS